MLDPKRAKAAPARAGSDPRVEQSWPAPLDPRNISGVRSIQACDEARP
jgi:hypothetical protein